MEDNQLLADQPLGHKLIKKGFWLYFFSFIAAPVGYLIKVLISNTLSVEDIGIFYSVLGLITLVSLYNDLGLTEALQYFLPKYWINKEYNNYKTILYITFLLQFISGVFVSVVMYFSADWLALHHFKSLEAANIIKTLCWYFIGINFLQVFQSIFMSFQDVSSGNVTNTVNLYSTLLFVFLFWLFHALTIDTFAYSWIISMGVSILVASLFFIFKYKKTLKVGIFHFDKSIILKQFRYAFWVFLGANVGSLLGQVDQQLVVNFLGPKQAGYYTNFYSLLGVFSTLIGPILGLVFPLVTEMITKNDHQKMSLFQNILYKYFTVGSLSVSGLFFVFGPLISSVLFGSKFLYSGVLLQYISPVLAMNVLVLINFGILAGLGKVKHRVSIITIALIVNVCLNALLVIFLHLGLLGVLLSLAASWFVLWYLSFRIIDRYEPIRFDWKFFFRNFFVIIVMSLFCWFVKIKFFVIQDSSRLYNLVYLIGIIIIYYSFLALANYKSIFALINEIKSMKKST